MRVMRIARFYSRIVAAVSAAFASVFATVFVPTVVITAFTVWRRSPAEIEEFALAVAEPLALVGAVGATYLVSWWAIRLSKDGRALVPWVAGSAAAALVAAATWTRDFDWWTVLAACLVPAAAILAGRRLPAPNPLRPREAALPPADALERSEPRRAAQAEELADRR
jgi:hypothetical protein